MRGCASASRGMGAARYSVGGEACVCARARARVCVRVNQVGRRQGARGAYPPNYSCPSTSTAVRWGEVAGAVSNGACSAQRQWEARGNERTSRSKVCLIPQQEMLLRIATSLEWVGMANRRIAVAEEVRGAATCGVA